MPDYGVVPEIRAEIKFFAGIFLKDVLLIAAVMGGAFTLTNLFPTEQTFQQSLFMILAAILTVYLDLRPSTNPGKRNFEIIWMLIINRQPKTYKSYGYYEFKSAYQVGKEEERFGN